jgi:poly(hydroxyalkanoate) depolymerase family esterase
VGRPGRVPLLKRERTVLLSLLALGAGLVHAISAQASSLQEIVDFGANPGNLRMFVAVPPDLPARSPLVVLAHGCLQSAQDIADMSGWVELAMTHRFALVLPQTSQENDSFAGCFRTWEPAHQERGAGEPLSVRNMVEWLSAHHAIDRRRIFMTGLSSGGHLTNVMLAAYPELLAAGAPQSSFPYKCATSFQQVAPCCLGKITHSGKEWGELVRSANPGYQGRRPRVAIWHGSADPLLLIANLDAQMEQWTDALGVDDVPDDIVSEGRLSRWLYADTSGRTRVETNTIRGMGHAVAIDPGAQPRRCGELRPYAEDVGVCAAARIAQWFGIIR